MMYFASTKPVFFLSEIIPCLDESMTVDQLFGILSSKLPGLKLAARKVEEDYEIFSIPAEQPYRLKPEELKQQQIFLTKKELPRLLTQNIEKYITKKVGKNWDDPVIIERLRKAIVAQKDDYWRPSAKRSLQYIKGYSVLGYLAYHFPVYFMQTEHLLLMLGREGLLKKSMTILDVGTGPGVVPFAIADFYSRLSEAEARIYSVEKSDEHREAFMYLRDAFVPKGGRVSVKSPLQSDIRSLDLARLPDKIDLLIFSNVLNELPAQSMRTFGPRRDFTMRRAAARSSKALRA